MSNAGNSLLQAPFFISPLFTDRSHARTRIFPFFFPTALRAYTNRRDQGGENRSAGELKEGEVNDHTNRPLSKCQFSYLIF